jgi:hypothetical protein
VDSTRRMVRSRTSRSSESQRSRSGSSRAGPSTATTPTSWSPASAASDNSSSGRWKGGGEPAGNVAGVAVLAVGQVALDDRLEARLAKIAAEQPVQRGGVAANRGRRQDATWAKNAAPLRQRPHPVGAFREVVQRADQGRAHGRSSWLAASTQPCSSTSIPQSPMVQQYKSRTAVVTLTFGIVS